MKNNASDKGLEMTGGTTITENISHSSGLGAVYLFTEGKINMNDTSRVFANTADTNKCAGIVFFATGSPPENQELVLSDEAQVGTFGTGGNLTDANGIKLIGNTKIKIESDVLSKDPVAEIEPAAYTEGTVILKGASNRVKNNHQKFKVKLQAGPPSKQWEIDQDGKLKEK